jgi:ubiquinone/menaquinone biosynthesis C-methylase UbiE
MAECSYLMEGEEEAIRLDVKTDGRAVERQARWAGLRPGMRVADLGCGSGKATFHLHKLVQPGGTAVGMDIARQRIDYARQHYRAEGLEFTVRDIREPLGDLGPFDFIWIRFVLEYYLVQSAEMVCNAARALAPGGILCLIDLDCNCLRSYGFPPRLERAVNGIMAGLAEHRNFDPYVGIKLYSFLYDIGFEQLRVKVIPHNLIYGTFKKNETFNWIKKAEIAGRLSGVAFDEYPGGFDEFFAETQRCLSDPRAFTYTPLVICCGRAPVR